MEDEGIAVRREELTAYGEKLKKQIAVLEKEIWEMTGQEFNINSPKQLGEILFEKMQIKGGKKTKTGYSTAADVLEKLAPDYPVIQKILDYRQYPQPLQPDDHGDGPYLQHGAEPPEHSDPHGAWTGDPEGLCAAGRIPVPGCRLLPDRAARPRPHVRR